MRVSCCGRACYFRELLKENCFQPVVDCELLRVSCPWWSIVEGVLFLGSSCRERERGWLLFDSGYQSQMCSTEVQIPSTCSQHPLDIAWEYSKHDIANKLSTCYSQLSDMLSTDLHATLNMLSLQLSTALNMFSNFCHNTNRFLLTL